jgi:hypothetical protein
MVAPAMTHLTPGAANDPCEHCMCYMHVVPIWKKGYEATFTRLGQLCCMLCSPVQGNKACNKAPFCLLFVSFVPTASHMRVMHLVFACLAGCPRCHWIYILTTTKLQWNLLGTCTLVAHLCTADIMSSSELEHFFGFANLVKILQY